MKRLNSAFYSDTVELEWKDVWRLIRGQTIKGGALLIAVGRMPDNGCPCDNCRRYYDGQTKSKSVRWIDRIQGRKEAPQAVETGTD